MIIEEEIEKTEKVKVVKEIRCDKCDKCMSPEKWIVEGVVFDMSFGYGSAYDGSEYRGCLCDDCVEKFLGSLKQYEIIHQM